MSKWGSIENVKKGPLSPGETRAFGGCKCQKSCVKCLVRVGGRG